MNALLHQVAERIVHHPLPLDARLAAETGADDQHIVVAAAFGAGVAGMGRAVVLDVEVFRRQCRQALAHGFDDRAHAGSTLRNGLTLTLA
ncbi:hypothetical protein D3C72_2396330 [compost metagenome]